MTGDLEPARRAILALAQRETILPGGLPSEQATILAHALAGLVATIAPLSSSLDLGQREAAVVMCLVISQIDPTIAARLESRGLPGEITNGALAGLLYFDDLGGAVRDLGQSGRLRVLALVESSEDDLGAAPRPWGRRTLRANDRLLELVLGGPGRDPALEHLFTTRTDVRAELVIDPRAREGLRAAMERDAPILVRGPRGLGRRSLILQVSHALGQIPLVIEASRLARDPVDLDNELRAVAREARLADVRPVVLELDVLDVPQLDLVVATLPSLVATAGLGPLPRPIPTAVNILIEPANPSSLATLWLEELGQGGPSDAEYFADIYPLAPAVICSAAAATLRASGRDRVAAEHVRAGIRSVLDTRLERFGQRLNVTQTWKNIVIPDDQMTLVIELIARVRSRRRVYDQWGFGALVGRGLGVSALFSGPPGTGKTMLAGLVANELGLDIYQIDVPRIVSKWLGETERQLGELFDAAAAGNAVLLFDEADSLFSKRTDVRSSNDRYANLETNYILQRLDSFTGMCILTTNHDSNLDPAVQRRLSLHLRLQVPDATERRAIWQALLPEAAPVADVDDDVFDALAERYVMSGGHIKNAVLRAAFLAAHRDTEISPHLLELSARVEYESIGKLAL